MASFAILFRRIMPATSKKRFFGIFLIGRPAHHPPRPDNPFQRAPDGAMRLPASVGVPVNRSDRREREGRAESEEDQDRQDGAMHDQQDPAEEGRSSEGDDLGASWRERRKDPSDEDPEGRSEDEQGPCDTEEQVSLDAQAERDGVVERHRESEQRKGKEETRRQGRPSRSCPVRKGATSNEDRRDNKEDREGGEIGRASC